MRLLLLLLLGLVSLCAPAQVLYTPLFPNENSGITIVADGSLGNQGLAGYNPNDVYVHIGVITNLSTTPNDWKYSKFQWGTTDAAAKATSIGTNRWLYAIPGSLRSFFGITNPAETIQRIAFLFRSGDGNRVLRNKDGSDMYIRVYVAGAPAIRIVQPLQQATFNRATDPEVLQPGIQKLTVATTGAATVNATLNGNSILSNAATTNDTTGTFFNLPAPGAYQLIATTTIGATTVADTLNLNVGGGSSPIAPLPAGLQDGINYEGGGTAATLVLRAPGKNLVYALGEFNNWTRSAASTMNKTPDGKFFWLRLTGLLPNTEYAYQYLVDDTIRIADPYTEKVLDPFADGAIPAATYPGLKAYPAGQQGIVSILHPGKPAYNWAVPNFSRPDRRGLVVYELLLRDFVAARNWQTLKDTLPYLKRLGINAIELMPFNEFENNESWGYNPSFYFAPDKFYGTETALKNFIDECHKQGIAVIMDIALNHSFGQSPMVQLYWNRLLNRPADNNPWYNPVAKHDFNVGYDMNHESPDTRYFTSRVVEHWLKEYKIDGYRFDLSKGFTQNATCDANGGNCNVGAWGNYDASRVAIWKRYYDTLQLKSAGSYVILEHFAANQEEKELADYGMMFWGNSNKEYTEAAMGYIPGSNFNWVLHTSRNWNSPHVLGYMESHDEERLVVKNIKFGAANASYSTKPLDTALRRMQASAAMFLTLPGPKMIWQFGELGYDFAINYCPDGSEKQECRTANKPIRWDYLTNPKRKAVFDTYSSLINLRFHPWYRQAFISGNVTHALTDTVKWVRLTTDTSSLVAIANFGISPSTASVTFSSGGTWYNFFENTVFTATGSAQTFALQPGEYRVYVNRNVNNVVATGLRPDPLPQVVQAAIAAPNPTSGQFTLSFDATASGQTSIQLLNGTGSVIRNLHQGFVPRGRRQFVFNRTGAGSGVYYLRIQMTGGAAALVPVVFQ